MKMTKENSDDAIVGIVVAVLLIGLVLSVISMVQIVYVPQWLEQTESEHMQDVSNQFAQLKYALDILAVVEQKNAISTHITLGSKELPIFGSGRTYGSIEILSDSCNVTVANSTNSLKFSLGTIKYSSGNSYFVDQSYIYEAGILILSQSTASTLNGKPLLSVSNSTNLSLNVFNISGIEGKMQAGGFGTYSIYTEFNSSNAYTVYNLSSINITTNYPNAWRIFFNSTNLKYYGLIYQIKDNGNGITVEFSGSLVNLYLKVIEISTQIAPGWIE